ncbi:Hsp20/alpha crystallin family protein [Bacillus sp. JJ1764]|uniref:Hsp20/alpha crystallin family protein n=1 Tax=Bacillus sp. JJ1764 TaxID=3122964 RepID=UPI002FFF193E
MEIDKFKHWMDVAQKFQTETFWNKIFDTQQKNPSPISPTSSINDFFPKCDLFEIDKKLVVEAEIPGISRENLRISIQQQVLTITGEFISLQSNCKYYVKERMNRKFKKELTLPYPILIQKVKTEIQQGILYIMMPINEEEVEDIPISVNPTSNE